LCDSFREMFKFAFEGVYLFNLFLFTHYIIFMPFSYVVRHSCSEIVTVDLVVCYEVSRCHKFYVVIFIPSSFLIVVGVNSTVIKILEGCRFVYLIRPLSVLNKNALICGSYLMPALITVTFRSVAKSLILVQSVDFYSEL